MEEARSQQRSLNHDRDFRNQACTLATIVWVGVMWCDLKATQQMPVLCFRLLITHQHRSTALLVLSFPHYSSTVIPSVAN